MRVFAFFVLLSSLTTTSAFVNPTLKAKLNSANHGPVVFGRSPTSPFSSALSQSPNEEDTTSSKKDIKNNFKGVRKAMSLAAASFVVLSNLVTPLVSPAFAAESRLVGEIRGSGLVFKDTLNIESFEDPKVKGVTLYISNFQRPLTERLQKDFFSDPSQAAVGCAKTGEVSIADNIAIGKQGEEVFEEKRSLLFKELKVQRIYDQGKNTVVYVSFNTRLDKNDDTNKSRFKSSICAVNLD